MKRSCRNGLVAFALLGGMQSMAAHAGSDLRAQVQLKATTLATPDTYRPHNQITIVPDSELESLGVSADHKTLETPDGRIYQCDTGFYAIEVKGQGTIWCSGKEL